MENLSYYAEFKPKEGKAAVSGYVNDPVVEGYFKLRYFNFSDPQSDVPHEAFSAMRMAVETADSISRQNIIDFGIYQNRLDMITVKGLKSKNGVSEVEVVYNLDVAFVERVGTGDNVVELNIFSKPWDSNSRGTTVFTQFDKDSGKPTGQSVTEHKIRSSE